jgi:hypothetical protein
MYFSGLIRCMAVSPDSQWVAFMEFLFLVKEVILDESANIQNSFEEDQGN